MRGAPDIFLMAVALSVLSLMVGVAAGDARSANTLAADETPLAAVSEKIPGVALIARAQTNYAVNCQGCHRADGEGFADRVPSMRGTVSRFLQVPGGREYLVRVPGMTNAAVSDADLAELANWVIYRFDPDHIPSDFQPYTTREIAENRPQAYTSEAGAVRERLLAEIAASAPAQARIENEQ